VIYKIGKTEAQLEVNIFHKPVNISESALTMLRELLRSAKPGTYFTLESVLVIEKSLKSKGGSLPD